MDKTWLVVYTAPRAEKKAADELAKRGFEAYVPLQRILRQWSDRKKWVEVPLFNSYVFVRIFPHEVDAVLQVSGMLRFVRFSGRLAEVRQSEIELIKTILQHEIPLEIAPKELLIGASITVKAGPLIGLQGELVSRFGSKWVKVKIRQLEQVLLVKMSIEQIEGLASAAV